MYWYVYVHISIYRRHAYVSLIFVCWRQQSWQNELLFAYRQNCSTKTHKKPNCDNKSNKKTWNKNRISNSNKIVEQNAIVNKMSQSSAQLCQAFRITQIYNIYIPLYIIHTYVLVVLLFTLQFHLKFNQIADQKFTRTTFNGVHSSFYYYSIKIMLHIKS